MKLTNPEKMIILMLSEQHIKHKVSSDLNPQMIKRAIISGNTWALSWDNEMITEGSPEEPTPEHVRTVANHLDMWEHLERDFNALNAAGKAEVAKLADPLGKHVMFHGYDGNNEIEYMSAARFFVDDMNRWSVFKGRDLNSHMPSVEGYDRMLKVYRPILNTLDEPELSAQQIAKVLNGWKAK